MNKWTIKLIGLTLLLAAAAACGGEPATDRTPTPKPTATPTDVAPAQVPADWHLVAVPRGEPQNQTIPQCIIRTVQAMLNIGSCLSHTITKLLAGRP